MAETQAELALPLISPADAYVGKVAWKRHMDGANWLMADGHLAFHAYPTRWEAVPERTWADPKLASDLPSKQWFPWLATDTASW